MTELSENANKLLEFLNKTGGAWESKCMEALYPKPIYVGTYNKEYSKKEIEIIQKNHWQWEADAFGNDIKRPVLEVFNYFNSNDNYSRKTSEAYHELKNLGLAEEASNGFNVYFIYPTKK